MKALFVHSGNLYGGTERGLEAVAQAPRFCPELEPHFALCFEGRFSQRLRALGTRVDLLGAVRISRPDRVLRARRHLAALLRSSAPDVAITQSPWTHVLFAPVVKRSGLPLALWVHDDFSRGSWLLRAAARFQPDLLICNSSYSQESARNVFPGVRSEVIFSPLAHEPIEVSREEIRRQHHVAEDEVVIINVARMEPYKGQRLLIEALARLPKEPRWKCWIVGGSQRSSEQKFERSLWKAARASHLQDHVAFLGQRSDVDDLLAAADIFCQANEQPEPFGLAVVEALSAGLPIVATSLGGPRGIVTDACGRLVEAGDARRLAEALHDLVMDAAARRRLALGGPPRAFELSDPSSRLRQMVRALQPLLAGAAA